VTEAIVSCGFDNRFGFPAPAVMERFRKRGIAVHRTDQEGAIRAVSDGTVWVIEAIIGKD
jgi:competence protein ComEC